MTPERLSRAWWTWLRAVGVTLAVLYFITAGTILAIKYWLLPNVTAYSDSIEQAVSRAVGERVTIGAIHAVWEGLHAELRLKDVRIHDRQGRVALELPDVEAVVGWRSIPLGTVRLHSLALNRP